MWPAFIPDAFQANGLWNRNTLSMIPSKRMVIASRGATSGKIDPGNPESKYNRNLQLLAVAP